MVPAIALPTAGQLVTPSWRRAQSTPHRRRAIYLLTAMANTLYFPAYVVVALVGGVVEILWRRPGRHVVVAGLGALHGVALWGSRR